MLNAFKNKKLHQKIKHHRRKEIFRKFGPPKKIETHETKGLLSFIKKYHQERKVFIKKLSESSIKKLSRLIRKREIEKKLSLDFSKEDIMEKLRKIIKKS